MSAFTSQEMAIPAKLEPPTAPQNKYAALMPGHSSERKAKSVSGSMARSTDEMSAPMANAMMRFAFTESIKTPAAPRKPESGNRRRAREGRPRQGVQRGRESSYRATHKPPPQPASASYQRGF